LYSPNHTGSADIDHFSLNLANEAATLALGAEISAILRPGLIIFLSGNLGAGKTTLTRGILRGLEYEGKVKSPTYNLVEVYKFSRLYFYHFDFYRFDSPLEWEEAGFRDYFASGSICLVEWPERAGELLPTPDLKLSFHITTTDQRRVEIQAHTEAGKRCLKYWQTLKKP